MSIVNDPRSCLLNYVNWRGTTRSNGYSLLLTWSTFNLHYQCPPCNSRHLRDSDVTRSPANWQRPFWSHPDDVTQRWPIRAWFPTESGYPWGLWLAGRRGGLAIGAGIGWGALDFPSSYISHSCIERPCLRAKRPREKIIQGWTLTFVSPAPRVSSPLGNVSRPQDTATRPALTRATETDQKRSWQRRYFGTSEGSRSQFKVDMMCGLRSLFAVTWHLRGARWLLLAIWRYAFATWYA